MGRSKKRLVIIFTILFIINMLSQSRLIIGESTSQNLEKIAEWVIGEYTSTTLATILATQGSLYKNANLTAPIANQNNRKISANLAGTISNYSVDSWSNGANKNYWQLSFSTVDYSDIKFTASSWSTSNGPRDFAIDFSINNGDSWTRILDTEREIKGTSPTTPTWNNILLPDEANNKESIIIRIMMISNIASGSNAKINPTIASINRLNNISVYGKPIKLEEPIVPDPAPDLNPPDNTGDPNKPDEPETPQEPTEPEVPELPEIPEDQDQPDSPEIPKVPEEPETPEQPIDPEIPEIPDVTDLPKESDKPEVPEVPEVPVIPETQYTTPASESNEVSISKTIQISHNILPNPINDTELKISIETLDITKFPPHIQDIIEKHPIFDIKAYKGNTQISDFDDGRIIITLPYTLEKNEDKSGILIYYIDENNNISIVTTSYYDESTNQISFSTDHLSIYAIGYNKVEFNDIKVSPAKDYITYLAARNIVVGTGNNNFKPTNNITRAEFIKLLSSLGFLTKGNDYNLNFTDVNPNDWYTPCIKWAYENSITYGITTSKFNPNKYLTQEEMAVMIFRFLDKISYNFPRTSTTKVRDINNTNPWAMDAVEMIQQSKIIDKLNHEFIPNNTVTREEAATIISIILQYMSGI